MAAASGNFRGQSGDKEEKVFLARREAGRRSGRGLPHGFCLEPGLQIALIILLTLLTFRLRAEAAFLSPSAIDANAALDFGDDNRPRIAADGKGNWVAVWYTRENFGGKIGNDADLLVSTSADNGRTWTGALPLNTDAATDELGDFNADIATDRNGLWICVWYTFNDYGDRIGHDADIVFARSTDNGRTWSNPEPLCAHAYEDFMIDISPRVATDGAGNWVVTWWSQDPLHDTIGFDADILSSRSTDNGQTWSAVAPVNSNAAVDSGVDISPHLATDKRGGWVVVWESRDSLGGTIGDDRDILSARSNDNGATWAAPVPVNRNAPKDVGKDYDPIIATDGLGTWMTVWWSTDSLGGFIGEDTDILCARSTDVGASWGDPVWINPNADADYTSDLLPSITTDGAGLWFITWQYYGNGDADVWLRVSFDAGEHWESYMQLNTNYATDEGYDFFPQILGDGAGNWIGVWESLDSLGGTIGRDRDILFTRGTFKNTVPPRAWTRYR